MRDSERWKVLAALAAAEQDPEKLVELVRQINELLDEKERRLSRHKRDPDSKPLA